MEPFEEQIPFRHVGVDAWLSPSHSPSHYVDVGACGAIVGGGVHADVEEDAQGGRGGGDARAGQHVAFVVALGPCMGSCMSPFVDGEQQRERGCVVQG